MITRHSNILPGGARRICVGLVLGAIGVTSITGLSGTTQASVETKPPNRGLALKRKGPATRAMVIAAQQRLAELGYWIGEADGKWGSASRDALIAFQKVEGRTRSGKLTSSEIQALNDATPPSPLERGSAHIEVDLKRQVLFVVDADGTVSRILPVSTGSGRMFTTENYTQPAVTPTGRFHVYRKVDGWRESALGLLYYPNYIVGGIAIHGNPAVPVEPASHGCVRIPMFAAEPLSEMMPIGTEVIVHDGGEITFSASRSARQHQTETWNHR